MEQAQNLTQTAPSQPPPTPAAPPKKFSLQTCTLLEFLEHALHDKSLWNEVVTDFKATRGGYEDDKANKRPIKTFVNNLKYSPPLPPSPPPPPVTLSHKLEERDETPRQRANRLNAQKSTGPRTPEGKARSSQNAIKHGLTSEVHLQTCFEEDGDFTLFQEELHNHFKPADFYQRQLVSRIVTCMWRLRRAPIIEAQLLNFKTADGYKPELAWMLSNADRQLLNLSRYESNLDRQLNRCLLLLNEAKAEHSTSPEACCERGSVSKANSGGGVSERDQRSPVADSEPSDPYAERLTPSTFPPSRQSLIANRASGEAGDGDQSENYKTNPTASPTAHENADRRSLVAESGADEPRAPLHNIHKGHTS